MPECLEPGCDRSAKHRGLCHKHYERARRNGRLTIKQPKRGWPANLTEQLERQDSGCLYWTGRSGTPGGYGIVHVAPDRDIPVHVAAYELWVGPIPDGFEVDHLCHDPDTCHLSDGCPHRRCVEPTHLLPVPPLANSLRSNSPWAINARKTHCREGHPLPEYTPGERRRCWTCDTARRAQRRYVG